MNTLLQDEKAMITKKLGLFCGCMICIVLVMAGMFYQSITALLQGPKEYDEVKDAFLMNDQDADLEHAYVTMPVELITGSYAEYGEKKADQLQNQTVYYLMPVENGTYFMTVIANADVVPTLNQMESAFYNSIGKEQKEYPSSISLQGGFRRLSDEELVYALDYFSAYDAAIQSKEDLPSLLGVYAFVNEEINGISVTGLWTIMTAWIVLAAVSIVAILLYVTKFFMRPLLKDLKQLDEQQQTLINEDYQKALSIDHLRIGTHFLYRQDRLTWRVWDYKKLIWIYQQEVVGKSKRVWRVCVFNETGQKFTIWQGEEEKKAKRILHKIFDHMDDALMGYEPYLYEVWKKDRSLLKEKCAMLSVKGQASQKPIQKQASDQPKQQNVQEKQEEAEQTSSHKQNIKQKKTVNRTKEKAKNKKQEKQKETRQAEEKEPVKEEKEE